MSKNSFIKIEHIASSIFFIRGEKVLLDFHLASLYQVDTRVLKQQVKRNLERFPKDFMFQLSNQEWKEVITYCDNLGQHKYSPTTPLAFTEQGVAMLSGLLRSKRAVGVNIAIMRTFVQMRRLLDTNRALSKKIEQLEKQYNNQFKMVFAALKKLVKEDAQSRKLIGFQTVKKK